MNHYLSKFCEGAIDWIWRRRSRGLKLIRVGVSMLLTLFGVKLLGGFVLDTPYGRFEMTLGSVYGIGNFSSLVVFLAAILIIYGLFVLHGEQRRIGKKRVIAIELRGLRDTAGDALKDSIPLTNLGRREQILINIRRADGRLIDPNEALQQVMTIPSLISSYEAGYDRSDIKFVAGGLAPVPFSFLMGVLLDDESSVDLMDWDRSRNRWRSLNGSNNGDSFAIKGMGSAGEAEEIVLSISVSYPTDMPEIARAFAGQPVIEMSLPRFSIDGHWSESKQIALANEFFNVMREMSGTNVKRVNLILAAPNSIVIRFGQIYDKRNLPPITVWQYENGQKPAYPWGVDMPVAGSTARVYRHAGVG